MQFFTNAGSLSACVLGIYASNIGTVPRTINMHSLLSYLSDAFQFNTYMVEVGFMLLCVVFVMVVFVREERHDDDGTKGTQK